MATLVTRSGKGSPLTHDEVDANFNNLNTDKLEVSGGTMTGDLILNAGPTVALGAATKQYVDTIAAAGIHYHDPVRVESPVNLNATYNNGASGVGATLTNAGTLAAITVDGVALSLNDRVLVYQQTDATQNGVYTVTTVGDGSTAWVLTRATDADAYGTSDPAALGEGDAFFVKEGDTGAGELYVMNTEGTITFGTTNITFSVIAETAVYSAGTGMSLDGTTFSIDSTVVVDSDIGSTVQAYDVNTAKYDDATANFTGTLQNGGSNVVVDTDIGSTVQAYDANLQGFVDTFTLPTTDGTEGQILSTDGAGNLTLADAAGGGGQYDFTASGAITAGNILSVNSDGTVSETIGLGSLYSSTVTGYNSYRDDSIDYDATNEHIGECTANTSGYPVFSIWTDSGSGLTKAASLTLQTSTAYTVTVLYDSYAGYWWVFYATGTSGIVKLISVSGTTPSVSATYSLDTGPKSYGLGFVKAGYNSTAGHVGVAYHSTSSYASIPYGIVLYENGSGGIAAYTRQMLEANSSSSNITGSPTNVVYDPTIGRFVFCIKAVASSYYLRMYTFNQSSNGKAIVGTSADAISPYEGAEGCLIDGKAHFIVTSSSTSKSYLISAAGTSSANKVDLGSINLYRVRLREINGKIYGIYSYITGNNVYLSEWNNLTRTFSPGQLIYTISGNDRHKFTLQKLIPSDTYYAKAGGSSSLTVLKQTTGTEGNFIGFSTQTVSDGSSVTVTHIGGVNENQTGLTPSKFYYLNGQSLTLDSAGIKAGRAISTTKILVTGDGA